MGPLLQLASMKIRPSVAFHVIVALVSAIAPIRAQSYKAIKAAGGTEHTLVLLQNGDLTACGLNGYGQLGLASSVYNVTRPRNIASNVTDVACGYQYSLYLSGGSVYAFGANDSGQLGTGDLVSGPSRRMVLTGVTAVAAGDDFSFFLMDDGSVRSTGRNINGQLGLGDYNNRSVPTAVSGLPPIKAIASGKDHVLFLATDGSVFGCGANASGQLGLGDDVQRPTPTRIPGLPAIRKVSAGIGYSLFLTASGDEAWGCGYNVDGQIFESSVGSFSSPARLFASGTKIMDIAAGAAFCLFIEERTSGRVLLGRGNNAYNQLGLGGFGPAERTARVIGMKAPEAVFASYYNGFVRSSTQLKPNGPLQFVTGYNSQGQAGTGDTAMAATPRPMLLVSPSIVHVTPVKDATVKSTYRNQYRITNAPYAGAASFRQTGNGASGMKKIPQLANDGPVIERSLVKPVAGGKAIKFSDFVQVYDRSLQLAGSNSIQRKSKFAWSNKKTKMTYRQIR
jgi:alpha-tubulin suppressor-like RCC1 family protein